MKAKLIAAVALQCGGVLLMSCDKISREPAGCKLTDVQVIRDCSGTYLRIYPWQEGGSVNFTDYRVVNPKVLKRYQDLETVSLCYEETEEKPRRPIIQCDLLHEFEADVKVTATPEH